MTAVLDAPATEVLGSTTPRLFTPPVVTGPPGPCGCGCALTPETSLGFQAVQFAETCVTDTRTGRLVRLLPWQRWWLIHALETRPDGSFRFRTVLTLVSRQNGKTILLRIVTLWFLFLGHGQLVLGAAQDLKTAKESWEDVCRTVRASPELADEVDLTPGRGVKTGAGFETLETLSGARYKITATNGSAGRGLSVDLLILDELREQRTTEGWAALSSTTMARPNALTVGISNQGDDESVVLNTLRSAALAEADPRLMLAEWSAPDGCSLDDVQALAQANPGLGRTITLEALASARATSSPMDFRTENLCQRVDKLDAAIDPEAWSATADGALTLAPHRSRLTYCVEVSLDGFTVLAAAALTDDGTAVAQVVKTWETAIEARDELRHKFAEHTPRAVGWYPGTTAEVIGAELHDQHGKTIGQWNVPRTELLEHAPGVVDLSGRDVIAVCEGLSTAVSGRRFRHPGHALLDAHVAAATWKDMGNGRVFARRGAGRVTALYAVAGAVELARRLPLPKPRLKARIF